MKIAPEKNPHMNCTIFGIRNCDTMKRAFAWLDERGVEYEFHDYKKRGISVAQLGEWSARVGWQALLNTRGTTWRSLASAQQGNLTEQGALTLMSSNPSLIKRPVLVAGTAILVGYDIDAYSSLFLAP